MTTLLFSAGRNTIFYLETVTVFLRLFFYSQSHEETGRKVTVSTNLPTVQLYTSNFLEGGLPGKEGRVNVNRDGVCLETQFMPNAVNLEEKPQVILRKGGSYAVFTAFKFEVQEDD